jgi:ribosomal protein S27E
MPKSERYFECPACGRRTVLFHIDSRKGGEFYQCSRRDCTEDGRWICYPKGGRNLDKAGMESLRKVNPQRAEELRGLQTTSTSNRR